MEMSWVGMFAPIARTRKRCDGGGSDPQPSIRDA